MPSAAISLLAARARAASLSSPTGSTPFALSPEAVIERGAITVERYGRGEKALVFIAGLAGGAWSWSEMARRFSPDHAVYALTLAGFDGRPPAPGPVIDRVVADIAGFIEENRLDKPVLVGHSLGAFIALRVGVEHPALIGGLVTVDGYPVFPPLADVNAEGWRAAAGRLAQQFLVGNDFEKFRAVMLAFLAARMNDQERAGVLAERAARSDPGATSQYVVEMLSADLRPELVKLKAPLLALVAVNSYLNGHSEEEIRTFYSGLLGNAAHVSILLIRNARHFAAEDQPEVVGAAIEGFLAGLASCPS